MPKRLVSSLVVLLSLALFTAPAGATIETFSGAFNSVGANSHSAFQSELTGGLTLVNLDAAPLNAFASGYRVDDAGPAAAFLGLGIDFVLVNARVLAGQSAQIPALHGRDRLIFNGTQFDGNIVVNFVNPVDGVGAFSNEIDGGRVRAFSGASLGGTFLGEASFSNGNFGGLISTDPIGSVQFTCDFNADLKCGVFDIQFGTIAPEQEPTPGVPEPATLGLLAGGAALLGAVARRRAR